MNMRDKKNRVYLVLPATAVWLAAFLLSVPAASQNPASAQITIPVISEQSSPVVPMTPVAQDGHRGVGLLRKPPGPGPFPAVVMIHGNVVTRPAESLSRYALTAATPSRFLAAGYVVAVITYRSQDID